MLGHPPNHELMTYAEALVSGRTPIPAKTARHAAGCPKCAEEVRAIRRSLELATRAGVLEPDGRLRARILSAAQRERQALVATRSRHQSYVCLGKGLAFAAGLVVMAAVVFDGALGEGSAAPTATATVQRPATVTAWTMEEIHRAASQVRALAAAVSSSERPPRTLREWEQQRAALLLSADVAAALSALESNPTSLRVRRLVAANLQRQTQTLKTLYVDRQL